MESLLSGPHQRAHVAQMIAFMQSAKARGIDVMRTQVTVRAGVVTYAVLASQLPGRTLMLVSGTPRNAMCLADAQLLITKTVNEHLQSDASLMQVLIDPQDHDLAALYAGCEFTRLAKLDYLECPALPRPWQMPPSVSLETYSAQNHADFAAAIRASYEQTLDCPALNGVRSVEDVIAGHKAAGEFEPTDWFLLRHENRPAGVLLLARTPASDAMDLVYIGLSKPARGQGIADKLMKLALSRAAERSCRRLTTAADSCNKPAMQLYFRAGMQRIGSRLAMIRVVHRDQPTSSTIHPQNNK